MFRFNYGEYIFQQLITAEFVQLKLAQILMSLIVNFINMHLVSLLCLIVSVNVYIDPILQIAISVFCALKINHIYNLVEKYEPEFHQLTQYLINNYSVDNYRYWKRLVVIGACIYSSLLLLIIELTNWTVFIYIFQYVLCFLIVEQFEQHKIQQWIEKYRTRPKTKKLVNDPASEFLINSYMSPNKNVLKRKTRKKESFYLIRDHRKKSTVKSSWARKGPETEPYTPPQT